MPEQIWRGQVASTGARTKDGALKQYTVTFAADGTGTCTCTDYIIRSVNAGMPERPCKHIAQAYRVHGRAALAGTRPVGPQAPDVARRGAHGPDWGADTREADDAPPTRVDGAGLAPEDIRPRARRIRG